METGNNLRKLALLAGAALLSTSAMATPPADPLLTQTEIVKYSVPQSGTPEGAAKLYRRLQAAAVRVCSPRQVPLGTLPDAACVTDALNKAVADVGSPLVMAMYLKTHGAAGIAVAKETPSATQETLASR